MVPGTFTTHEVPLTGAWHVRKRSEGRVVGEPREGGELCESWAQTNSISRSSLCFAACLCFSVFYETAWETDAAAPIA